MAVEDVVERIVREAAPSALDRARQAFEAQTGAFVAGEAWYEERIAAFFDFALASFERGAMARSFAAQAGVSAVEAQTAVATTRAERSLFRVATDPRGIVLQCAIGGARYRVDTEGIAGRLQRGDLLDGRLVSIAGRIVLMPGAVFHPREAHEAIEALLERIRPDGRRSDAVADALLRMRMRFDRFTSIHARHVYRHEAMDRLEILTAAWARPT